MITTLALFGLSDTDTIQLGIAALTALAAGAAVVNVIVTGISEQRRTQPIVIAHEEGGRRFSTAAAGPEWVVDTYLTGEAEGAAFNVRFGVEFNGVRYPYRYRIEDPETGSIQRVLKPGERRPPTGAVSIPFDSDTMWARAADSKSDGDLDTKRLYWARYENARGQTWETRNPGVRSERLDIRRVRRPKRVEQREQRERRDAEVRGEEWLKRALQELRDGMTDDASSSELSPGGSLRRRCHDRAMNPTPDPTWTDIAQVALVAAQLVVLIVAAGVAWRQVSEAKRLREEQTRPFVVVDFEVEGQMIFLSVSNLGTTLARDVTFEIDPPLRSAVDADLEDIKLIREGAPTLAPGKVIRAFFDSAMQREHVGLLPDSYRVIARYADQERRRTFEETIDLDLRVNYVSTVDRKNVHDIHQRIVEIRDVLKRWSSSNGALRHASFEDDRAESDRRRAILEERRRQRREDPPSPPELTTP